MEKGHLERIRRRFPEALSGKRVICLHIRDEYEYMDAALIDELRAALAPHIQIPEE